MSEVKPNPVRDAILALTAAKDAGKTIAPEDAAKAISLEHFVRVLKDVRAEAIRLHKAGTVLIYRKGKPVENPDTFKGVYRLGLPGKGGNGETP